MTPYELFSRLLTYALVYWPGFVLALLAMIVVAVTEAAFPALMKPLLDQGFQSATSFQVWWVPTAVLMIFVARGVANFLVSYSMNWIANNVLRDLRQQLFEKLLCLPATFFDRNSSGMLITKIIVEVHLVLIAATNVATVAVRDSLILIGLLAWLFWLNWKLTLIVLLLMPLLVFLGFRFSRRMREISSRFMLASGEMTSSVEEVIGGNRLIKIFDGKNQELGRFKRINAAYRAQAMRLAIAQAIQSPVSQLIAAIGVAAVITIALIQSQAGSATVGDFVSFITAMLMMFGPLRHLTDINSQIQRGLVAAESIFSLLDEQSEVERGSGELPGVIGSVRFENVRLDYYGRDHPAVDGVSIEIPAGKTTAFVGPSGSGKTSLINLLPRIYELSDGKIFIDEISIQDISLHCLRQQLALVSQDVILFNDTIRNNITYGSSDVSDDQLWRAIRLADLYDFISGLPQSVQTIVGDRGVQLSGGQRQRIAIARAIVKDAPILILDEATSALDSASEASVKQAIDAVREGRTTLVIAHRLTTIINADQIVVMDRGKVVQIGTHSELVKVDGLYKTLFLQMQNSDIVH